MVLFGSSPSILTPIIVLAAILLFVGAIVGLRILKVIRKLKKLAKKHENLHTNGRTDLKKNGFSTSKEYEYLDFYKYKNYSFELFLDSQNKRLAIFSYREKELSYFTFDQIKSIEVFLNGESLGNTVPQSINQDTVGSFKINIATSHKDFPVYKIKLKRGNKKHSIFSAGDAIKFTRDIVDAINEVIAYNQSNK